MEYGLIIPQGIHHIARRVPEILEDASNELTDLVRALLARLLDHLKELDQQVKELKVQIGDWHRDNELSRKLEAVPGIGPITASALVATVGDAKNFHNGRQLAAWLGLVPKQDSTSPPSNVGTVLRPGRIQSSAHTTNDGDDVRFSKVGLIAPSLMPAPLQIAADQSPIRFHHTAQDSWLP